MKTQNWNELKKQIEKSIDDLKCSTQATECWVALGVLKGKTTYVYVGEEFPSLDNTGFAVITAATAHHLLHFESEKQARMYGFNHYLLSGDNKPIYMKAQRLSDYAAERIQEAEEVLETINVFIQ